MICYLHDLNYISIYIFFNVFNHVVTNDPKITLIRYLHQKIHTKHDHNVENNVYLRLNINRIGFTGEPVTG